MSTLDSNLEWPRFCYSNSKESPQDNSNETSGNKDQVKNRMGRKLTVSKNLMKTEKISTRPSDEQLSEESQTEKFAFSQLMRQMAKKYQEKNETPERQSEQNFSFSPPSETLPPFPIDPLILRAAFGPFFPFPLPSQPPNFFPAFSSSQALIALAAKKRSVAEENTESLHSSLKRQAEDPLDLSSAQQSPKKSRVDNSDDPPELWSVDQVTQFVQSIDTCQEYGEVFRNHSIDGSALLQLTENHMTRILGLKLGPAIKLRIGIRELIQKTSASPSTSSSSASVTSPTPTTSTSSTHSSGMNSIKVTLS